MCKVHERDVETHHGQKTGSCQNEEGRTSEEIEAQDRLQHVGEALRHAAPNLLLVLTQEGRKMDDTSVVVADVGLGTIFRDSNETAVEEDVLSEQRLQIRIRQSPFSVRQRCNRETSLSQNTLIDTELAAVDIHRFPTCAHFPRSGLKAEA